MDTAYIILGFFICIFLIYIIWYSYEMDMEYDDDDQEIRDIKNDLVRHREQIVIRCKPEERKPVKKINTYENNQYISNRSFVNELIYKPEITLNQVEQPKPIIGDIDDLKSISNPTCEFSNDLPIANINVNYLLDKNTSKLQ